jgi:hypothetical protein
MNDLYLARPLPPGTNATKNTTPAAPCLPAWWRHSLRQSSAPVFARSSKTAPRSPPHHTVRLYRALHVLLKKKTMAHGRDLLYTLADGVALTTVSVPIPCV